MKHCPKLRKWFISYALQGIGISSLTIIISLFVITQLKGTIQEATTAAAIYSLGSLLGSLFVGHHLDRTDNYSQIIFWGLSLSSFFSLCLPFTGHLALYLLLVLFLGISTALVNPSIILFLNRNHDEFHYRQNVTLLTQMNSIGLTVGTFIGGFLLLSHIPSYYKSYIIFIAGALLFAGAALISLGPVKDAKIFYSSPKKQLPRSFLSLRPVFAELRLLPRKIPNSIHFLRYSKEIIIYLLGIFIAFIGANLFFTPFSIYLKQSFHLSEGIILLGYGLSSVAASIAYFFTQQVMKRFRDFHIIRTALFVRFISFLAIILFGYLHSSLATFIAFIVIGFTWPFFYLPATIQITQLAHPKNKGRILGLFNVVISVATIFASLVSGIMIQHWGYLLVYFIGAILLLIGERIIRYVAIIVPVPTQNKKNSRVLLNSRVNRNLKIVPDIE